MPYDKDGKYYRQPTNSVNKNKKDSNTTSNKPTYSNIEIYQINYFLIKDYKKVGSKRDGR